MKLSRTFETLIRKPKALRCVSLGVAIATLLTGAHGTLAQSAPEVGLVSDNQYIGQQFFWNASWSGNWTADQDLTGAVVDQGEQLVLHGDLGNFGVLFTYDTMADAFAREIDPDKLATGEMVVLGSDAFLGANDVPYLSATVELASDGGPVIEYLEIAPAMDFSYADGSQVTILVAPEADFEQAFRDAQGEILPNGGDAGPLFAGTPVDIPNSGGASSGNDQTSVSSGDPASESAYLDSLNGEIDTLAQSVTDFQTLMQDPSFGDEATMSELTRILAIWISSYDRAVSIQPPAQFVEMHQTFLEFTALLGAAANDIVTADFDAATNHLSEAQTKLMRLERMLESGGTDIFDAKSG